MAGTKSSPCVHRSYQDAAVWIISYFAAEEHAM
jgi:hypothetical protein